MPLAKIIFNSDYDIYHRIADNLLKLRILVKLNNAFLD